MQLSYQNLQGNQGFVPNRIGRPAEGMFGNRIDYDRDLELCKDFLLNYTDQFGPQDEVHGPKKYLAALQKAACIPDSILEVCVDDLENHFGEALDKQQFIHRVKDNTMSYVWLFGAAADMIINEQRPTSQKSVMKDETEDHLDTVNQFRAAGFERSTLSGNKQANEIANLLKRKFDVSIIPAGPHTKRVITPLRHLKAGAIGSLVTIRANVVRTSEVKPLMSIACYVCEACGTEIYQSVSPNAYCPTTECPSDTCKNNRVRGKVTPHHGVSKFQSFQELRVQETSDQTPMGNIPLSFTVHCKNGLTRKCSPGEIVFLTGILLPKPNESLQRSGDNLLHQVYIEAMKIEVENVKFAEVELGEHLVRQLQAESQAPGVFERLAKSICPEIFGMDFVKQSLLLQMVSGSTLTKTDGVKIRGDINIALIGDPGVAKSQLLKAIAHLTPRGVYTSGKGSSGAGLTAAVIRDSTTNEVSLEGGALVLADRGICCIDEFDKMEERDRTSIHEVMEQQSVSIAKAGITTTLNARTSILAAANPVFGRYNRLRSPHENINLPASLLSRFDLIFILLDRPNPQTDMEMADHITYVHQNSAHPTNSQAYQNVYSAEFLKAYIAYAKKFDPLIPQDLFNYITSKYVEARKRSSRGHNGSSSSSTGCADTTPRTLLALIRLSQAHAKIRFSNIVSRFDVDLALDLMASSQSALTEGFDEIGAKRLSKKDPISMIYQIIREELTHREHKTMPIAELENRLIVKGFSPSDMHKCIANYSQLDVLLATEENLTLVKE